MLHSTKQLQGLGQSKMKTFILNRKLIFLLKLGVNPGVADKAGKQTWMYFFSPSLAWKLRNVVRALQFFLSVK